MNAFSIRAARRVRPLLAAMAALALLAGCGSGGSNTGGDGSAGTADTAPASGVATVAAELKFLGDYMRDWYLWRQQMPATDISAAASVQAGLDLLRVPQDRYSFVESAQLYNAFYDDGRALGFGLAYIVVDQAVPIRYVQPNGAASAAGLRRGDRLVGIGGVATTTLLAENRLDAAFGPDQEGWSTTLEVDRDGQRLSLPMTKSWYTLVNVLDARVIVDQGRRVGYVNLLAFTQPARSEWEAAIARLLADGAQDLVVDLRDNGGGLLSVATAIATSVVPSANAGQRWLTLAFNELHRNSDQTLVLGTPAGAFERLAWITSPRTCSASEAVIEGAAAFRSSVRIGETSCGKPVGFTPPEFGGKVYNIVSFRLSNAAGVTDWFGGLAPDCAVTDNYRGALGDPSEAKLAASLAFLRDGRCPPQAKTAASRGGAPAVPQEQGMARQTGLR